MFHHRALRTMIAATALVGLVALGGPTVASADSRPPPRRASAGPNNENYDPPIYAPTAGRVRGHARQPARPRAGASTRAWPSTPGCRTSPRARSSRHSSTRSSSAPRRPGSATGSPTATSPSASRSTSSSPPAATRRCSSRSRSSAWSPGRGRRASGCPPRPSRRRTRRGSTASRRRGRRPHGRSSCSRTARSRCAHPATSKLPATADQVRRPQAERAAQHQRLHRRGRRRLATRRPEEGAEDAAPDGHPVGPRVRAEQHPLRLDRAPGAVLGRASPGRWPRAGSRTSTASSTPRRTAGRSRATSTAARSSTKAPPARSQQDKRCVTLGIPPTVDVGDPKWGLSANDRRLAERYVDAYLWFGRPWLYNQAAPVPARPGAGPGPHHALLTGTDHRVAAGARGVFRIATDGHDRTTPRGRLSDRGLRASAGRRPARRSARC